MTSSERRPSVPVPSDDRRYRSRFPRVGNRATRSIRRRTNARSKYERILVPPDGSDETGVVLDRAAALATTHEATVGVLYVVDDRAFLTPADDLKAGVLAELHRRGVRPTAAACERFETAGVPVERTVRQGNPGSAIVEYATERDAGCIVTGSHADYEASMLDSVSRRVVAGSPVPVLTVGVGATVEARAGA